MAKPANKPTRVMVVPVEHVSTVWERVKPFLIAGMYEGNDAPSWSDCYNIHHVQGFVTSGTWMLIVAIDDASEVHGAATISFANYPIQRVAFITLVGGRMLASNELADQMKAILRDRGATKVQGYGRPSIVRLWKRLGFEPRTTLIEAKL